jgi:hypothetical protein
MTTYLEIQSKKTNTGPHPTGENFYPKKILGRPYTWGGLLLIDPRRKSEKISGRIISRQGGHGTHPGVCLPGL